VTESNVREYSMRTTVCLLFLIAAPIVAQEKSSSTALTPKEIADGWIMLFDGESTFGWKADGEAKVVGGNLQLSGGEKGASLTMPVPFAACDLRLEVASGSGNGELMLGDRNLVIQFSKTPVIWTAAVRSTGRVGGVTGPDKKGDVFVFGTQGQATGPAELKIKALSGQTISIKSLLLRPAETMPLFNGKDLTGWKVFPGAKDRKVTSKFTVTPEGWLNVKDGPGDLQTEGQWGDFVVQFDCISNGKHLNSGLFFRCLPGQYQQGYEAQIRNEWTGDDRTKPVDFGTGAIYRRQAARKVVSTDKEWFTMTVAAHGRNIATWVNGYQVVSWTDDRKESENARQGFKAGKGALSIQGHDPTTDLSFRNIRIQSLDPK
jgi:hypothetical protein